MSRFSENNFLNYSKKQKFYKIKVFAKKNNNVALIIYLFSIQETSNWSLADWWTPIYQSLDFEKQLLENFKKTISQDQEIGK